MLKTVLTETEKAALTQLRLNRKSSISERAHYVLLSAEGLSAPAIARPLNCHVITIRLWLKRYLKDGLSGLETRKQPGRPAKKAPLLEAQLKTLLSQSPQAYGYQEAGWTLPLLRDWFTQQGASICDNTLVKSLKQLGFVYKRFSKTLPSNAPFPADKKAGVATMVEAIQAQSSDDTAVFFADESHFANQPYVSRGWFKRGEKNSNHSKAPTQ